MQQMGGMQRRLVSLGAASRSRFSQAEPTLAICRCGRMWREAIEEKEETMLRITIIKASVYYSLFFYYIAPFSHGALVKTFA